MIKRLWKSRITKKIFGILLIMGMSSFVLDGTVGMINEVHAQDATAKADNAASAEKPKDSVPDKTDYMQIVDLLLKVIYVLLWPLLVIAGTALDNSMVYASFLHLDAPLWKFWNIIKNFANFALGFVVLFAIVRKIFSFGKSGDKREPTKIITQALIGGILIQASWFMMAALVDLSTIATYAIGGLPLNVLGSTDLGQFKILQVNSSLDLDKFDTKDKDQQYFKVWYGTKYNNSGVLLSECKKDKGFVIGRLNGDPKFLNKGIFGGGEETNACVLFGNQIVIFNEFPNTKDVTNNTDYQKANNDAWTLSNKDPTAYEKCKYVIRTRGTSTSTDTCEKAMTTLTSVRPSTDDTTLDTLKAPKAYDDISFGMEAGSTWLKNNKQATTLDTLIKGSKGFVGPLVTIYSSMLDFAQISNTQSSTSFGEMTGEMLIKMAFAIGLFFPLIALALVLIVRIGFLWMAIVLSPFLVLIETFKRGDSLGGMLKDHFSMSNIIKVIFAPVITVFALSISLIFMSTLIQSLNSSGGGESMGMKNISEKANESTYIMPGGASLNIMGETWTVGGTLDGFSWFIVNLIAIGLMRAVVFMAIKSNSIGKELGGQVEKFGASVFQTLPIVPIGGESKVGFGTLASAMQTYPGQILDTKYRTQVSETMAEFNKNNQSISESEARTIVEHIASNPNMKPEDITKYIASTANVTEANIGSAAGRSIASMVKSVEGLDTKEKKQKVISALATTMGGDVKWFAKYKLEEKIKGITKLEDANTALEEITKEIPEPQELLGKKKTIGTTEYIIEQDDNNKFVFKPTTKAPAGKEQ